MKKNNPIVLLFTNISKDCISLIAEPFTALFPQGVVMSSAVSALERHTYEPAVLREQLQKDVQMAVDKKYGIVLVCHQKPDASFAKGIATHVLDFGDTDDVVIPKSIFTFNPITKETVFEKLKLILYAIGMNESIGTI